MVKVFQNIKRMVLLVLVISLFAPHLASAMEEQPEHFIGISHSARAFEDSALDNPNQHGSHTDSSNLQEQLDKSLKKHVVFAVGVGCFILAAVIFSINKWNNVIKD